MTSLTVDDDVIADHLLRDPTFFVRHAYLADQLRIPHPIRDSVSLLEWQLSRQRQKIRCLEEEMTQLMELVSANEKLFGQLLLLQNELISAEDFTDFLAHLQRWARQQGLKGIEIRLFKEQWHLDPPSCFTHLSLARQQFEPVRIQRLRESGHYLGTLNDSELQLLLPNAGTVGSVALSSLGQQDELGVVIFISNDRQHYQANMGTLLLQHFSNFLPVLLQRWIKRRE